MGASGNVSVYEGGYAAPSVYDIEGFGIEEGGTGGEGTIVSGHVNMSETYTNASFNIVDWINELFREDEQECIN